MPQSMMYPAHRVVVAEATMAKILATQLTAAFAIALPKTEGAFRY